MDCKAFRVSEELLKYFRRDGASYVSGQLRVVAETRQGGPATRMGIRYSLDDWASWRDVDGARSAGTSRFVICSESTIAPGTRMRYAIYCIANGSTYWDNNHAKDYVAEF